MILNPTIMRNDMSKRVDFTRALRVLLDSMIQNDDRPILDYVKRSDQEQKRLFDAGLSKCDGYRNVSKHQIALAADIYLINDDGSLHDWSLDDRAVKYHRLWESLGGKPMISWDQGHFEWGG